MAFGDTPQKKTRRRRRNQQYRCLTCGDLRYPQGVRGGGTIVPACEKHPDVEVVEWKGQHQAAALWIEQKVDGGATMAQLEAEIRELPAEAAGRGVLETVFPLVQAWGGLPERALPLTSLTSASYNPLFDGPAPPTSQERHQ